MTGEFKMVQGSSGGVSIPLVLKISGWIIIAIGVIGCLYILTTFNQVNRGMFNTVGRGTGLSTQAMMVAIGFALYHAAFGLLGIGIAECLERLSAFSISIEQAAAAGSERGLSTVQRSTVSQIRCKSCGETVQAGPENPFCGQCGARAI